ncbi:PadR family transcriptional regulator [Nocardia panacis]|uniref:PadR family transcriptional regulator n=1 Tax=Nocardia panacis TaxID=2340916 RepID=A0A3A4K508_9NOCA|nr:PadR family transcriptional regulator [Nocardia panacis]RJO80384.1 PadR family transcriptional regulator [Nocardia panacis]
MAERAVTPLALVVLGLLEEQSMHPYEMYQLIIARQEDELVKVRPGSLYHTVARLADQGYVQAEGVEREGNRPERTTYRITEQGRAAMRQRVADILREPTNEFPAFPVGLAESHNLPKEDVLALLRERVQALEARYAQINAAGESAVARAVPRRYWIVLPYLRATIGAELDWLRRFAHEVDSGGIEWERYDTATGGRMAPEESNGAAVSNGESTH